MRKWIKSSYSFRFFVFFSFFLALFLLSGALCAQNEQEGKVLPPFGEVVSEDYSLDKLYTQVKKGQVSAIPKDKYIIIEGVVSSRQVIQPDEENFFGILEISSGSWDQGEDLEMYRCYFQLRGSEFYGTIPEGRSREPSPKEIPLHSHLLAVGTYLGYGEDAEGNKFPVLQAVNIRRLRM